MMLATIHSLFSILIVFIISVVGTTVAAQDRNAVPKRTFEDVSYGSHVNQIIDFWQADVDGPAPLVVFIHGGGFKGGSHKKTSGAKVREYLDAGIHHASVEYRFMKHARLPAAHEDAVRALQFLRSKAKEWGIDKTRIAAYGGSAGAQLVAYLAWNDDFADSENEDPIARESSRLTAVAPTGGQSSMNLDWWVKNIPGYKRSFHRSSESQAYNDLSSIEKRALIKELSIVTHISPDDPPTFMSYGMGPDAAIPTDPKRARGWSIHHVKFGMVMEEKLRENGVEAYLKYPGVSLPFDSDVSFLIHQLKK